LRVNPNILISGKHFKTVPCKINKLAFLDGEDACLA
jgi:hypothetical protein